MASESGKGHGRREARSIVTTTWLNGYLAAWPGLEQAFRLVRRRTVKGVTTEEVVYGITSLPRSTAGAGDLLGLCRAHWAIENGLRHMRDETLREDRCRVRRGTAPRVLASLRNLAVYLLKRRGGASGAAATRELATRPEQAVAIVTTPDSISA